MYAKRLRTYERVGFSLISERKAAKQTANAIYDSGNYDDAFERDLIEAENSRYGNSLFTGDMIRDMQKAGINVVVRDEVIEHFAVMDDALVWHGGMNLPFYCPNCVRSYICSVKAAGMDIPTLS